VAVLTPASRAEAVCELLGASADDERVSVLTVERAKGLEFDSVLLVAPDEITGGSPRGLNDLYVALTRATRRLGVVQTGDAVPALDGLG
jgi:superfamily I DNA/RNA helicase